MRSSILIAAQFLSVLVNGYTVAPPTTAPANTITDCTYWDVVVSGDTCASLAADYALTLAQWYSYNPSTSASSCNLIIGDSYCVEENYGLGPTSSSGGTTSTSSTSSSTSKTTTTTSKSSSTASKTTSTSTTPTNGITTPTPIQTGMVSNCNTFYLVVSGDQCGNLATQFGISLANFYLWNPAVGSTCTGLDVGDYVCVNVIGGTTSSVASTTTAKPNGITTPTPVQTGMVSNCDSFYFVVSGDTCANIASANGISLANFYLWNPAVGSTCSSLWLGDYVCVNIIGGTTATPTPTSTNNDGVTTPTPIQTGMVTNCDKFHYVVSGDGCAAIASAAGITLAQFYSWNPAVGSSCGSLWLSTYCCIGIL